MPELTIYIPDVFDGPRMDRLRRIWQSVRLYQTDVDITLLPWPDGKPLSHAEMFNHFWEVARKDAGQYVLFTELDFLPNLRANRWHGLPFLKKYADYSGLGVPYHTRNSDTKRLIAHPGKAGGWFVLLNRDKCPLRMDFSGTPDPCNQLSQQIPMVLVKGQDCFPSHYGISYEMGTHLFWSRHLNDDPDTVISGFRLGDVQHRHDRAVESWIRTQPPAFRTILERSESTISA
jgi:hypothetical protein